MRSPPAQQHPYIPSVLHPPKDPNPDYLVFSKEEMDMIVKESELAGAPVSAHCCTLKGAMAAIEAGVNTIEHVYFGTDDMFMRMIDKGVIMVPTLAIAEKLYAQWFDQILKQVKRAHDLGVRLACGGGTGTYPHGDNVRELELMIEASIPVVDMLEPCTVGGWEDEIETLIFSDKNLSWNAVALENSGLGFEDGSLLIDDMLVDDLNALQWAPDWNLVFGEIL
ncbi:hypothetical protein GCG54_00012395 [Colletotrichum gloeosporioides]|uniref:Amidohydrolase-related domain-containing protein n=1 Tax=Colletotrichum gloeosporioides TaxID=474922 RepID=A0A8H4CE88_COLGL|nr:uncharacterized protein GCG54_00012395 [Colletotrichum gloeosporioides]KAF3802149.1 hypothetical protein GCG54_00012395 [Colletotrichum gloeosporioides]